MDNAYQRLGNDNKSIYDYLRKPFKNLICPNVTYTLFGIVSLICPNVTYTLFGIVSC